MHGESPKNPLQLLFSQFETGAHRNGCQGNTKDQRRSPKSSQSIGAGEETWPSERTCFFSSRNRLKGLCEIRSQPLDTMGKARPAISNDPSPWQKAILDAAPPQDAWRPAALKAQCEKRGQKLKKLLGHSMRLSSMLLKPREFWRSAASKTQWEKCSRKL